MTHFSLASINDTTFPSLTCLITRGESETFCLLGVIVISLSSIPPNHFPLLSVTLRMIVLDPHFCNAPPKLDTAEIFRFLRKFSEILLFVDAILVETDGAETGAWIAICGDLCVVMVCGVDVVF